MWAVQSPSCTKAGLEDVEAEQARGRKEHLNPQITEELLGQQHSRIQ